MLRIHKILTLSISGLLLAGMAMTAHAQVESLPTQSITDPTDFSGSFLFTKFNPTLGTLNQVDIVLGTNFTTTITVTNTGTLASTGRTNTDLQAALYDSSTTLSAPSNTLTATGGIFHLIDDVSTANQSYSVNAGGSTTLPSKSASDNLDSSPGFTDSSTLAFFTGASGTTQVRYRTFTTTNLNNTGGNTASTQTTTDTLSATITYYYTPRVTATPEPGTWALMVAGASTGLVALRRRRRNKK